MRLIIAFATTMFVMTVNVTLDAKSRIQDGGGRALPDPLSAEMRPVRSDPERSSSRFPDPVKLTLIAVGLATGLRAGWGARRSVED